ncbi:hypothetical protein SLS53_009172 [Cytospora paraplurivora]|uniref:Uncharacterized protein n=1 Tax=Cytospora paraplurivora TaxID=2898453 RepID=A0AAN9TXA2_9PEZI
MAYDIALNACEESTRLVEDHLELSPEGVGHHAMDRGLEWRKVNEVGKMPQSDAVVEKETAEFLEVDVCIR